MNLYKKREKGVDGNFGIVVCVIMEAMNYAGIEGIR